MKKGRMLLGKLFRQKYVKVYITKEVGNQIQIIDTQWFNIKNESFIINNYTYAINLKNPVIDNKNNPELYYKQDNANPLNMNESPSRINNKQITAIMKTRLFQQLLFYEREKWFFIGIAGLICAVVAIAFWGVWNMQQSQSQFLETIEFMANRTRGN